MLSFYDFIFSSLLWCFSIFQLDENLLPAAYDCMLWTLANFQISCQARFLQESHYLHKVNCWMYNRNHQKTKMIHIFVFSDGTCKKNCAAKNLNDILFRWNLLKVLRAMNSAMLSGCITGQLILIFICICCICICICIFINILSHFGRW